MTVAVALVCNDGVLLASDSMGTSGALATNVVKVRTCNGLPLVWTWAGSAYLGQQVGRALDQWAEQVDASTWAQYDAHAAAEELVARVRDAVSKALVPLLPPSSGEGGHEAEFLIASNTNSGPFVAHVRDDLSWELEGHNRLVAIGSGHQFAAVTRGLMRHYIDDGVTMEQAKAVAYRAIETVCDVSSYGVSVPVQIALVSSEGAKVLDSDEVAGIDLTVQRWKILERETLRAGFTGSNHQPANDPPPTLRPDLPVP